MIYVTLLLLLVVDLLSIFFCYFLIREMLIFRNTAPFVPTRASAVDEIVQVIGMLPAGSVMYDLGCGEGRILRAVADKNPESRYVGLDIRRIPYYLAKHKSKGRDNMLFERGDFYKKDFSDATHIYTYLYPKVMVGLQPKFEKELKPGTMLYSLDFPFKDKQPVRTIRLAAPSKKSLAKELYVYEF